MNEKKFLSVFMKFMRNIITIILVLLLLLFFYWLAETVIAEEGWQRGSMYLLGVVAATSVYALVVTLVCRLLTCWIKIPDRRAAAAYSLQYILSLYLTNHFWDVLLMAENDMTQISILNFCLDFLMLFTLGSAYWGIIYLLNCFFRFSDDNKLKWPF